MHYYIKHMLIVIFDDETMKGSKTYLLRWCTLLVWFPISSINHWSSYLGNASTSEAFEFQRKGGGDDLRGEAEHWQPDVPSKYVVHGTNNLKHSDFISKNDYYNKIKKFDILTKWIFFLHKNVIFSNILASFPVVAKAQRPWTSVGTW